MAFDFSKHTLGPVERIFAQAITVLPYKSVPGAAPYAASGVWSNKPTEYQLQDGAIFSTNEQRLFIRVSSFPAIPKKGDQIILNAILFDIIDTRVDGVGGGADLWLKAGKAKS